MTTRERYYSLLAACLTVLLLSPIVRVHAQAEPPVVRAVLFYSPACGHCEYVIKETLVPLTEQYGEQLQIFAVDVSQPDSQELFFGALQKFELEGGGVPFLVFGDMYLIGSADIPERFPGLVEALLAQGGRDWPDIPGLQDAIAKTQGEDPAAGTAASGQTVSEPANWTERFARDPVGNTLSVIVLAGMLGTVSWTAGLFQKTRTVPRRDRRAWLIPLLCIAGIGIAGYLAYVETNQIPAVCGPVGDCNTVQQSEYAYLFGILPIGVLGLPGYQIILAAWLIGRYARPRFARAAVISMFGLAVAGTLFSIYLTFLEPFVIGATCAWCLTSAIVMTALMLLTAAPAKAALSGLLRPRPQPLYSRR